MKKGERIYSPEEVWYCNRCTTIMKEEEYKFSSINANNIRNGNENSNGYHEFSSAKRL